ncbi:DNA-directed RNA polymerase III subunit RPC7-like [Centruroides sculpturatus]|uniref:DNA-directed RNA polymerase III subunit RPC7-like n=1 Tax=Centruroides sculpturatus TaxID=218467 RepID=UPI000C6D2F4B|nr:DNA-directed RNA polymerase III subunit RPC7-like [Centruroides sculpturatus]
MSGRGRKPRGRRKDVVDDVRGENVPPPIIQPPAMYPPLEFKPVPLISNEEENYLLALKQELRGTLRDSGFYVQPVLVKKDIERYSDKYQQKDMTANDIKWDFKRFPKELKDIKRKRPAAKQPKVSKKRKKNFSQDDIKNKLEQLETNEKSETSEEEQEEAKEDEEEGDKDEEELYDEEEQEEGTDYAVNYFDNGEDYLDEDDNMDDGPLY